MARPCSSELREKLHIHSRKGARKTGQQQTRLVKESQLPDQLLEAQMQSLLFEIQPRPQHHLDVLIVDAQKLDFTV